METEEVQKFTWLFPYIFEYLNELVFKKKKPFGQYETCLLTEIKFAARAQQSVDKHLRSVG